MRVRLLPADKGGCAFYRHEEPCRVAREEGVDAWICRREFTIFNGPLGRLVCDEEPEGEGRRITEWQDDVVVFQRPAKRTVVEMIPLLQKRGVACVVDIDDDLTALPPQHPCYDGFNPGMRPDCNWRHLIKAAELADMVTVTTPALAERYAPHGRVRVLPNCVPQELLDMPRESDGQTVGWAGTHAMHYGDLEATYGGVKEALRLNPEWSFLVIGDTPGIAEALNLSSVKGTGWLLIDEWHEALGKLDLGIVPLALSKFNQAKSWLKGIEYAARGVPFIASPTGPYLELGLGVIAENRGRTWKAKLDTLMRDYDLRAEIAGHAREAVHERHTYESQGWRWQEAWADAMVRQPA